jgi:DNA mismatch endonuclease (patch repair protein)
MLAGLGAARAASDRMVSMKAAAYPLPSTPAMTAVMKGNRRRDTIPERRLRSTLHARGHRFRCDYQIDVQGYRVRADIAFPAQRVAIFVDGCFWHGCEIHGTKPRVNTTYWGPKLARNRERDLRVNESLAAGGWSVVRIWEHIDVQVAADLVQHLVSQESKKSSHRPKWLTDPLGGSP